MQKGCWKIDQNDEACYIDVEEEYEEDEDPNREYSQWSDLPDIILEEVFSMLTVRERYYASLTCRNWYRGFHMPSVWTNFVVDDRTLTRAKYNYYSGWQYVLDHMRTQSCLSRVGPYMRGIDFRPEHSFNNIYQFMTLMTWCIEKSWEPNCANELLGIGAKIKALSYVFPCNMAQTADPEGIKLFGTGGQLLLALKKFMSKLAGLKILKLVDLVLDRYEANHLLDEVLDAGCMVLRFLNLVNVTTVHCPIMHVGCFLKLQVLVISPQNIDDEVLQLLADTNLKHLHLLQNRYTPSHLYISPCSVKAWRALKRDNPRLKVHLRVESAKDGEFVFQPEAPVYSIVYKSPKTRISSDLLIRLVDNYKETLRIYGHEQLPRFASPKSFHTRVDSLLVLMARECSQLHTLTIREKVSTATVLLLARTMKHLKFLHVRRNAVILRCDWPKNPDWSEEFYAWLKRSSRSYEAVETEVTLIIGRRWSLLSDEAFKRLEINARGIV